ncbi:MAG: CHAT domain-containing protein [Cyanobacteria bacterium J06650_10]
MPLFCLFRRSQPLQQRKQQRIYKITCCLLLGIALAAFPALSNTFTPHAAAATAQSSSGTFLVSPLATDNIAQDLLAQDLIEQGRKEYHTQRYVAAVELWSQAAKIARTDNNPIEQALAFSYLTAAYQHLGQWENATDRISQSLDLVATISPSPTKQQLSAQVYNTLGSLQFAQGHSQLALETWQQAAERYQQTRDDLRYLNNLLNQVQAQRALGYYHQAEQTLSLLDQHLPQQPLSLQIRGHQQLGQTYRLIGDLAASERHLQRALTLAQQTTIETAPILIELGNTAQAQGNAEQAIARYQQTIDQTDHSTLQLKARLNQLKLFVSTDPAQSRMLGTLLTTELANMPAGRRRIYAYINAAQSFITLGTASDLKTAADWLAEALQQSISLQDSRAEAYARGYLGHVYERSHQWADAQTLTEAALTTAQTINAADITYQWQWQMGRILKQQHKKQQALQAYQNAFSTLQSIRQDLVATTSDLQFSFRDSVEPVYRELVDLLLQSPEERPAESLKTSPERGLSRLQQARSVMEALQVAELDNYFRTACLQSQQVSLEAVEQTEAAIIYPIILPDRLEIVVSLPGHPLKQYTAPVTQHELTQTLTDWRQNLEKTFTTPEGKVLGQRLYNWLMAPIQPDLSAANIKTLVFVLDGVLRNAPMSALYDENEHYLIEHYAISLAPGLQLLGPKPIQDTNSTALLAGLTQARHGFGALQNVDNELKTISALLESRLLLNENFTTEQLTQRVTASNQPIIHLATHGQFSSKADETFILAWDRPIPVTELSTILKSGDLNRSDPIELLILSACETATGDSRAALGLAGVALQSGTRATLASLWSLDDTSGAIFAEQFYQFLAQPNVTKAEALQQAQLALLKNPNYRHPTYWSAYVLLGNWL